MNRAAKTFIALCRSLEKFDEAKNVNSGEVVSGGVSIRAFDSAEYAEQTNIENQDACSLNKSVNYGVFHYMHLECRKATLILVAVGCLNVILSKRDPNADIVLTTLML